MLILREVLITAYNGLYALYTIQFVSLPERFIVSSADRLYVPSSKQTTDPGTVLSRAPVNVVGLVTLDPVPPPDGEANRVQSVAGAAGWLVASGR